MLFSILICGKENTEGFFFHNIYISIRIGSLQRNIGNMSGHEKQTAKDDTELLRKILKFLTDAQSDERTEENEQCGCMNRTSNDKVTLVVNRKDFEDIYKAIENRLEKNNKADVKISHCLVLDPFPSDGSRSFLRELKKKLKKYNIHISEDKEQSPDKAEGKDQDLTEPTNASHGKPEDKKESPDPAGPQRNSPKIADDIQHGSGISDDKVQAEQQRLNKDTRANEPILLICNNVARLDDDVINTVSKVSGTFRDRRILLVVLHCSKKDKLPKFLTKEKLKEIPTSINVIDVLDVAFDKKDRIYDCDMNKNAFESLNEFLKS